MAKSDMSVDEERMLAVLDCVAAAVLEERGFFSDSWKRQYLPQWDLPSEMEHDPQQTWAARPDLASRFLFTRLFMDRLTVSKRLHRRAKAAWDSEDRWIFDPDVVHARSETEVDAVLRGRFRYGIPITPDVSAAQGYLCCADKLVTDYGSDPRRIIDGKSVEQGLLELEVLPGYGPGIARLFMTEMYSRRIAVPSDAVQSLENKMDRHKTGILFNTGVLTSTDRQAHMAAVRAVCQDAYRAVFARLSYPNEDMDAALWVIGSEGCAKRRQSVCNLYCPLSATYCRRTVSMDHRSSYFRLIDRDGADITTRVDEGQFVLDLFGTQSK